MAVFFVTVDDDATRAQRDAFTNYVRKQEWGFWHHVSNSWLIVDSSNRCTAAQLREKVKELMPKVSMIAIKVEPQDYATFSRKSGFQWLRKYL